MPFPCCGTQVIFDAAQPTRVTATGIGAPAGRNYAGGVWRVAIYRSRVSYHYNPLYIYTRIDPYHDLVMKHCHQHKPISTIRLYHFHLGSHASLTNTNHYQPSTVFTVMNHQYLKVINHQFSTAIISHHEPFQSLFNMTILFLPIG